MMIYPKAEIRNNIEIILILGLMDLKLKYQNSKLGFLWSFIKPLLQFGVYYTVFTVFTKIGTGEYYPLRLFLGILIWVLFSESTGLGLNSYIGKKAIVTKIKVKRFLLPLAAYLTPLINFLLNFMIFLVLYFLIYPVSEKTYNLLDVAIFIISLISISIITVSFNLILANLNGFFRDIQPIWELVLTYGVFLTPIIYPIPIPEKYSVLYYSTNLIAFPLENIKSVFFDSTPKLYFNLELLLAHSIFTIVLLLIALKVHFKLNDKVIDYL